MTYEEWERTVPPEITGDVVWHITAYRLALFAADLGWRDVTVLGQDRRTWGLSDQLYRALGSINANIEEGYAKGTGKDRARFYEYALGSALLQRPTSAGAGSGTPPHAVADPDSTVVPWDAIIHLASLFPDVRARARARARTRQNGSGSKPTD